MRPLNETAASGLTAAPNRAVAALRAPFTRVRPGQFAMAVAAIEFALLVPLAYLLNIWQDEAYTLDTISGGVAHAFHQALVFEQNAPLYFVFLTLWRHVNESVFFLRLFSVLCATGVILLSAPIARRYLPHVDARLVVVAIAWNPFLIWSALEMRPYAMVILLSAVLLVLFFDGFIAAPPTAGGTVLYGACCAIAMYTEYYLAFLIAAQAVVLLVARRHAILAYAVAIALAAAAFFPMLVVVPEQVDAFRAAFIRPPSMLIEGGLVADILAHFVLPLPGGQAKFVYAGIAGAACILLTALRLRRAPKPDWLICAMTGAGAAVFTVATYVVGVRLLNRHVAPLYIPSVSAAFAGLTFLQVSARRRALVLWFCVALAASTAMIVQTYLPLAKPGDWLRVVSALRVREHPGEPIAVFEAENAPPFAYYYRGPNRIIAIPAAVNFQHYDVGSFVVPNSATLARTLPRAPRIWLITAGECRAANVMFGCDVVERYVRTHFRTTYDASFYGSRLRLLARRGQ